MPPKLSTTDFSITDSSVQPDGTKRKLVPHISLSSAEMCSTWGPQDLAKPLTLAKLRPDLSPATRHHGVAVARKRGWLAIAIVWRLAAGAYLTAASLAPAHRSRPGRTRRHACRTDGQDPLWTKG